MQIRGRALAFFIDHQPFHKAVKAVGRGGGVWLIFCQQMRKAPAGSGRGFEPAIAPAAVEIESVNVGLIYNG